MTRAEQEAFEKWMDEVSSWCSRREEMVEDMNGRDYRIAWVRSAFEVGYRAGFEAQHYEVDDA